MEEGAQGQAFSGRKDRKWKIGILGATGYTGITLLSILIGHRNVEVSLLTSNTYKGLAVSSVFPFLKGICDLSLEGMPSVFDRDLDVLFLCLPHGKSMEIVPKLYDGRRLIIDLGADFRFKDPELYERFYGPHSSKELLLYATYGLPELYRERIAASRLIANPGCYPTSAILALYPLLKANLLEGDIYIDSKSGVSGAGREAKVQNLFTEVSEGFRPYNVGSHRHQPEIEKEVKRFKEVSIIFVPHLLPINRGILTTVYTRVRKGVTTEEVLSLFRSTYREEPFVRILEEGNFPDTRQVRFSNYCDIGLKIFPDGRAVVVSAIDNLVKGASGQAVQNMNIAMGIQETEGLKQAPLYP